MEKDCDRCPSNTRITGSPLEPDSLTILATAWVAPFLSFLLDSDTVCFPAFDPFTVGF